MKLKSFSLCKPSEVPPGRFALVYPNEKPAVIIFATNVAVGDHPSRRYYVMFGGPGNVDAVHGPYLIFSDAIRGEVAIDITDDIRLNYSGEALLAGAASKQTFLKQQIGSIILATGKSFIVVRDQSAGAGYIAAIVDLSSGEILESENVEKLNGVAIKAWNLQLPNETIPAKPEITTLVTFPNDVF